MQTSKLQEMFGGWFVGNFDPSVFKTDQVEVAYKKMNVGEYDEMHYHKEATEITVVVKGEAEMDGRKVSAGDIIVMEPFQATDFRPITDVEFVVVKIPGAENDKYLGKPEH